MRVVWAGSFDPGFSRNSKLARLMTISGIQVVVIRQDVWVADRIGLATRLNWRVALGALYKYPLLLIRLLAAARPDAYLVSYPGWFDVAIVRIAASIKRRPLVFDPFLSLHDTVISDRQLHSPRSMVARLTTAVDKWSLRWADLIVADTRPHLELFEELAGGLRQDGVVIPVGADDEVFVPRRDLEVEPASVLFYGSLVPLQGVATIVEAAALLEPQGIRTTIIGDGQDRPILDDAIKRTGVRLDLSGLVPLDELPSRIACSSVCLGVFGGSDKAGRVVPHKLYESLAMGRPIVTRDGPGIRSLFSEGEVILVPPADPVALAHAIRALVDDAEHRERVAAAGHSAYQQRFHERRLAELLVEAFESVTN
jgi:glycosyltransferase involved in cell wall biosynthesis